MKTDLHLAAMPLAYPLHPSSQLGYLHGFIEQNFGHRVPVRSYHAFLPILYALEGLGMAEFFETYSLSGEEILYLTCCYHAIKSGEPADFLPQQDFDDALRRYNSYKTHPDNEAQQPLVPISREKIVAFCEAMESYLDKYLIPGLRDDTLNVIGFTASFCQVFGSVFAARHIQRNTKKPLLFVFGGSSYSLPEGSRTLSAWGVDGLLVSGSGEAPLAQLIEACLALEPGKDPVAEIAALKLVNIDRIGERPRPIRLDMSKSFMGTLPDPNYDDYFAYLRTLCRDDRAYRYLLNNLVSIPLEGSRGCFAKCDFCHNPNITSEFRSLTGEQVAKRTLAMVKRYQVPDVTFVDSVSNTWAEDYADYLLANGTPIRAFAEMRVHAPESFWVKLALAGVTTIQLGVEAIAEPLLSSMRKGTTVVQNLAATKYMAEMGTSNASNLIIHHPKSTVADVDETRRVMCLLEHFPIFLLSSFVVSYASPIYSELQPNQLAQLHRGFDWLPDELEEFGWPRHLSYTWPQSWFDPAVQMAWLEFQVWYAEYVREVDSRSIKPTFTVERAEDRLLFVDTRYGEVKRYSLTGDAMDIYQVCHRPSTVHRITETTGLSEAVIEEQVQELVARKAMIQIGDRSLSIAFRPRAELIDNLRLNAQRGTRRSSAQALTYIDGVR